MSFRLPRTPTPKPVTVELPRRKPMQALIDRDRVAVPEAAEKVLRGGKERVQSGTDASAEQLPA